MQSLRDSGSSVGMLSHQPSGNVLCLRVGPISSGFCLSSVKQNEIRVVIGKNLYLWEK
jgi:hypothetical protein